jgi:hypothetical protein
MRKKVALMGLITLVLSLPVLADSGESYSNDVRRNYPLIFVTRIVSAKAVTVDGTACVFKYDSEVQEGVRGSFRTRHLPFESELGLTVGDDYLVYFSEPDAKRLRHGPISPLDKVGRRCDQLISSYLLRDKASYLLRYNELHHVKEIWDGKRLVRTVEFSDAFADFGTEHTIDKTAHLINFDYVKAQLSGYSP